MRLTLEPPPVHACRAEPPPMAIDPHAARLARLACHLYRQSPEQYASDVVRRVAASDLKRARERGYAEWLDD